MILKFLYITQQEPLNSTKDGYSFIRKGTDTLFKKIHGFYRPYIIDKVTDYAFREIGVMMYIEKDIEADNTSLKKIRDIINKTIKKEDIGVVCFEEGFGDIIKSSLIVPKVEGKMSKNHLLCKKIIEDFSCLKDKSIQIGIILDKLSSYNNILDICKNFPVVIFICENKKVGDEFSQRIYNELGNSVYVSCDISNISKCHGVINLCGDVLDKGVSFFKCPYYIDIGKNIFYPKSDNIISGVKLKVEDFNFKNIKNFWFEPSILEGMYLLDKNLYNGESFMNKNFEKFTSYNRCIFKYEIIT